jgi:hypothetical protein
MLETSYSDFLNEEMSAISANKLRDAIHDIVVELTPKQILDIEELSDILSAEYKITISPLFIDKFLDEYLKARKGDTKAKTFFTREDTKWLGVRDTNGTKQIRNNLHFLAPSLGKHKQRLKKEDENKLIDRAYKAGMKDLNISEDLIKRTFVLQLPTDSEDMIKQIYKDAVVNQKYANTPENCWKMMMILGKNQKLDRKRNWFNLAPNAIKKYYAINGRIDYTIEKTNKDNESKKQSKKIVNKSPLDVSGEEKDNLRKIDKKLANYENWNAIIDDVEKREIIELIDTLTTEQPTNSTLFDSFLLKTNILTALLIKFYLVDKNDVYEFYHKIGFADFVAEWDKTQVRPKITDF